VYKQLLQLVPGLQERVFTAGEGDILEIADLVSYIFIIDLGCSHSARSRKAPIARGQMTRKVLRESF
jgi:hypothetical protein